MKISEILKANGIFSNEIRQRFKNKQIKLNGEITKDVELDIKPINDVFHVKAFGFKSGIIDAGDFIFDLIRQDKKFLLQLQIFDFETLANSNLNIELKKILNKFFIIRFSKKDAILVKKKV